MSITNVVLARIALTQGDFVQARALLTESLNLRRAGMLPGTWLWGGHFIIDAMSALAAAHDQAVRAAKLHGIADNMFSKNHHYRQAHLGREYAPYIAKARAMLGDEAYENAYVEGYSLTMDQAFEYALTIM